MTRRTVLLGLAVCLLGTTAAFAADNPHMGTWKLNEARSKIPAGAAKNDTVVYEQAGDNVKVTVKGTDASGKAYESVWTGKFDGKEYPLSGDPNGDMRAYKIANDRTLTLTTKKAGKPTVSGRIVVAADGKTRTVTTTGTDAQGQKISTTAVYDKQ